MKVREIKISTVPLWKCQNQDIYKQCVIIDTKNIWNNEHILDKNLDKSTMTQIDELSPLVVLAASAPLLFMFC